MSFAAGVITALISITLLKIMSASFNAGVEIAETVDKGTVTQCVEENVGLSPQLLNTEYTSLYPIHTKIKSVRFLNIML